MIKKLIKRLFAETYRTKYVSYVSGYCTTPCPFSIDYCLYTTTLVGSSTCTCCSSFISKNKKKKIIKCKGVCDFD